MQILLHKYCYYYTFCIIVSQWWLCRIRWLVSVFPITVLMSKGLNLLKRLDVIISKRIQYMYFYNIFNPYLGESHHWWDMFIKERRFNKEKRPTHLMRSITLFNILYIMYKCIFIYLWQMSRGLSQRQTVYLFCF